MPQSGVESDFFVRHRPMFTDEEWAKIRNMVVLVAGAGGLGSHQSMEFQRIGVKKIYLLDPDHVEASNLNRQVFYGRDDIGREKVAQAKEVLDSFGLGTEVVVRPERVTEETVIPPDVQILMCALDNFDSRFALGKLASKYNLPLVHGGVEAYYGQITTFIPGRSRSFQDIVGEVFTEGLTKRAFSPVVAIVAALQVIEAVNVLLNRDDVLVNKLLISDLRDYTMQIATV